MLVLKARIFTFISCADVKKSYTFIEKVGSQVKYKVAGLFVFSHIRMVGYFRVGYVGV